MIDFLLIVLIFLEIIGLYYAISKIIELNKKIQEMNEKIIEAGKTINEVHLKIQKTVHNINVFVAVLKNKKILQIKKLISTAISAIELVLILRSFNFKKGVKINLKNLKKLLFTKFSRRIVRKIISVIECTC